MDDGEKIVIKKTGKTPKFVSIAGHPRSTGLNVKIKRG